MTAAPGRGILGTRHRRGPEAEIAISSQPNRSSRAAPIEWSDVRAEWRNREYGTLRRAVSGLDGLALGDLDELLFATEPPTEEHARSVVGAAFAAASRTVDGPLLLALYVYGRSLEKWEQTEDYPRIRTVLRTLDEVAGGPRPDRAPAGSREQLLEIVVSQAQVIDGAMGVEDAMSCSCPVAVGERASGIVASLDALLGQERALGEELVGPREVVRADAETSRRYFDTVARIAEAVLAFVVDDAPGATSHFDDVLATLDDGDLEGDVYESELRAQRACLEALRDRADEPRLRVDAAELVYLYPFALDGIDAAEAVARARGDAVVATLDASGLGPATARELDVNDIWDRRDVPELGYSGTSIELPPIAVETTAGELLELTSEVRLSRLGNHHMLVRSRLADAGLHEVNQALRRGSHAMGDEKLSSGEREWTRFPRYADDVIRTIASALGATPVAHLLANLDTTSHVVLAARSISVQQPDGSTSAASPAELERAVGASLLFHPVRHLTTSLEEWIRYPPPTVTNLLRQQGYEGDLVARTDNTTLSFMPASPEWLVDEYEEMIEFVASIPPLLTLWETQALRLAERFDATVKQEHSSETLHDQELEMLQLQQDIRRQVLFLHSPALCRTRGQRRFLDELWTAAGLPRLELELERRLTLLTERQERVSALVSLAVERDRREQQKRTDRVRHRAEIVLGVLAAASLAGVLQWVHEAFHVDARFWAWFEAMVLLAAALTVFVLIWLGRRRT